MTQIWFFGCCEAADILGFEFEMGLFPNVLDEARSKGIDIAYAESELGKKSGVGSKIVVEKGYIVKLSKDKKGIIQREQLTRHWTDWIDYWSVDFDFENKREIIRVKDLESGEIREEWIGDFIFENEWQSFHTRKDRSLELKSVAHEVTTGRRKIAVKVVDIFGNDTMTIVEVTV